MKRRILHPKSPTINLIHIIQFSFIPALIADRHLEKSQVHMSWNNYKYNKNRRNSFLLQLPKIGQLSINWVSYNESFVTITSLIAEYSVSFQWFYNVLTHITGLFTRIVNIYCRVIISKLDEGRIPLFFPTVRNILILVLVHTFLQRVNNFRTIMLA